MSECFREWFIEDSNVKSSVQFDEELLRRGKSIYEVIRMFAGVPLFLEEHLSRLENSAGLIGKPMLQDEAAIKAQIKDLAEINNVVEGNVKIVFNYNENNTRALIYFVKHSYPSEEQYRTGVDTILFHGERDNPNAKIINSALREKVEREIVKNSVYEAILVDRDGNITEGSKSNIFMIKDRGIITAPLEAVLPGITRGILLQLISELGISVDERVINFHSLKEMDALFITGTSPKVLPIRKVEELVYDSSNNPTVKLIMEKYNEKIKSYIENFKDK